MFAQEAEKYHVYPLQNTTFARAVAPQPSPLAGQTVYTYSGEISGIPTDDAPSIKASRTRSPQTSTYRRAAAKG